MILNRIANDRVKLAYETPKPCHASQIHELAIKVPNIDANAGYFYHLWCQDLRTHQPRPCTVTVSFPSSSASSALRDLTLCSFGNRGYDRERLGERLRYRSLRITSSPLPIGASDAR